MGFYLDSVFLFFTGRHPISVIESFLTHTGVLTVFEILKERHGQRRCEIGVL